MQPVFIFSPHSTIILFETPLVPHPVIGPIQGVPSAPAPIQGSIQGFVQGSAPGPIKGVQDT